jgi:hypothetical protein
MMVRLRGFLFSALSIGIVVACSSTPATTTAPTQAAVATEAATPSPTAAPSPTPTPVPTFDVSSAAAAYLAMATAANEGNTNFVTAVQNATSDEELVAAYQLIVEVDTTAIAAIKAIKFPPDMKADVDALLAAYQTSLDIYTGLVANPGDPDPTIDARLQEGANAATAAATKIRAALGLPAPPPPATPRP